MIICIVLASIAFIVFAFFFMTAGNNAIKRMLVCLCETEAETIKKYQIELHLLRQSIERNKNIPSDEKMKQGKKITKKMEESKKRLEAYKNAKIGVLDLIPVAGYRLIEILGWDASNETVKSLYQKCVQYKEKKEAMHYTIYLLASLFGYLMLGAVAGFAAIAITLAMGMGTRGAVIGLVIFMAMAIIGYLPYDNVSVTIQKRKDEIEVQFPQVVSKLTLLVVAGMDVTKAWKLTCSSGTGVLYEEMNRVVIDLEHNVSVSEAFQKIIVRCNNPYTTKLATAIMQSMTRGNSEVAALLRDINDESWMEYKHTARRKGEQIQSKLMAPTLLMFLGIIVLIIIPVVSGFNF